MPATVNRFDRLPLGKVAKTDKGFEIPEAVITRAGVFDYRMDDGTIQKELRHPDDVFDEESMRSFAMRPVTDDHPVGMVTPDNAKTLAVGFTGENIRRDAHRMIVPIAVTTKEGIAAIESGKQQLSNGYTAEVFEESGTYDGIEYTHRQRNIRGNHVALVKQGRAGPETALKLDSGAAELVIQEPDKKENKVMASLKLDGIPYEVPPEVEVAFGKLTEKLKDVSTKHDESIKLKDTLEAERDGLKDKLSKAEKIDHAAKITAQVKERLGFVAKAQPLVKEDVKLDEMDKMEIVRAVISAKVDGFVFDDRSDDYLMARFDMLVEEHADAEKTRSDNAKKIIGDGSADEKLDSMDEARLKFEAEQAKASLGANS